jgi:hypothetical protein
MKKYGGVEIKLQHSQLQHQMMAISQLEVPTSDNFYYHAEFQDSKNQSVKLTGDRKIKQGIDKLTGIQQYVLLPLQSSSTSHVAVVEIGLIYMAPSLITNSHFVQRHVGGTNTRIMLLQFLKIPIIQFNSLLFMC